MRSLLIQLLLLLSIVASGQNVAPANSKLLTAKYEGEYSYGKSADKGHVGYVTVYPETDSTVLFYVELNIGPPSYNMGSLYNEVKILNDTGIFYLKDSDYDCRWGFKFEKGSLKISGDYKHNDCGFGYAVDADGIYERKSHKLIDKIVDLQGDTIFFKSFKR